ncbi:MAG: DMT family transporter [Clostridia bacterium]|jgi:drug/metabolite transporter (DMT)-like permease|nr:DMT family transporter [Clostridia bacterium]
MDRSSIFEKKSVMIIAALFCCLLWGSAFPSVKISYSLLNLANEFQKILFAGIRFTIAGLAVLVFAKVKLKIRIKPTRSEMPFILLIAMLQTFGMYTLYYIGIGNTTGVKASILVSMSVFVVVILAHFVFKNDKLSWRKIIGLILGIAGVVLVNFSLLDASLFSFSLTGEGFIAISSLFSAATAILIRKNAGKVDAVKLNGWQLFIGGLLLMTVGFIGYPHFPAFTWATGLLLIYLAAISAVAFTVWFVLIRHHNVSYLSQFKFAIPIFGSLLSVIFIPEEHLGLEILAAILLVALGTLIVNRRSKKNLKLE